MDRRVGDLVLAVAGAQRFGEPQSQQDIRLP
jgi:hypothetical protein